MPLYESISSSNSGGLLQTAFANVTTDVSTTSATLVDISGLSQTITTSGGTLCIWFTASASCTNGNKLIQFSLNVNGSAVSGARIQNVAPNGPVTTAIVWQSALAAGTYTVKIQWAQTAGGTTAQIRAATAPTIEDASLLIQEVSV